MKKEITISFGEIQIESTDGSKKSSVRKGEQCFADSKKRRADQTHTLLFSSLSARQSGCCVVFVRGKDERNPQSTGREKHGVGSGMRLRAQQRVQQVGGVGSGMMQSQGVSVITADTRLV